INNSSITLTTASDLDNKVVSGGISGNFAGIEIDDIRYYLTSDEFLMDYPFLDETLQIKEEDVGYIFNSVDQIGRASCRERVSISVAGGCLKIKGKQSVSAQLVREFR